MKTNYMEHEKAHWIYNEETGRLDEINPRPPSPVDFGKPNAHKITKLAGGTLFTVWVIAFTLILNGVRG